MSSIALAGSGFIAQIHALAAQHAGIEVCALGTRNPATKAPFAGQPLSRVGYDALPAGADAVVVCTPPFRHFDDAMDALAKGAAVIVEKPLVTTLEQADRLLAMAPTRIGYAENLAYSPLVMDVLRRIPSLGPLTHLEVRTLQSLPRWGNFTSDEWGGGALFDLGAHPLAIAVLAAAPRHVTSVRATLRGGAGHGSDEHAEVEIGFSDGFRATVVSSWQGPDDGLWDLQIAGERGVVRLELRPEPRAEMNGYDLELPETPVGLAVPVVSQFGYIDQLTSMLADFGAGRAPFMSGEFGRHVLDITCAAYASAAAGGAEVSVPFEGPRDLTPLQLWRS